MRISSSRAFRAAIWAVLIGLIALPTSCQKKPLPSPSAAPVASAANGDPAGSGAPASSPAAAPSAVTSSAPAASGAPGASTAPKPAIKTAPAGTVSVSALGPFDFAKLAFPPVDTFENYLAWMKANTKDKEKYLRLRWDRLVVDNGWHPENSIALRKAFLMTPREDFVRSYNLSHVYDHAAWPIEDGQTISGPHLVTRMTHNIDPKPGMKVLEIGTGSGYQSALLSFMTDQVYTIEIKPGLFGLTDAIYKKLEKDYPTYRNVKRMNADGYYGWEEYAPFDRIIVTCGIDHIPPALLKQLKPDGIMVIPIGPMNGEQVILKITKRVAPDGTTTLEREDIYGGKVVQAFVPFTASDGSWHEKNK
jgi:protein-L-isoaspartate(D-aspartate) O-methyltransferase